MSQIALPLEWPEQERDEDFILGDANAEAVRQLGHWALWPVPIMLLTGPRKSGRSLLGRLFAHKTGGEVIDDAWAAPEERLFHAWNAAMARRRPPLLLIADAPPPAWAVALPDLASRLAATPRVAIRDPDDALIADLLQHLLGRRGLSASPQLAHWLVGKIERSHVAIAEAVDALDRAALAGRRGLSIPVARAALVEARVIDA